MWAPRAASSSARRRRAEFGRGLGSRRNGPDAGVLAVEQLEPLRERPRRERRLELRGEIVLRVAELPLGEVGPADQLAGPREELRLERAERQVASVGGRVDPVARKRPGQRPRARLLAEPVADQLVAPMRHRDAHAGASTRAGAADERREHLRHRTEPAGREVCDLHRRPGRRVLEHAGPAEVVEVVTGALGVASLRRRSRSPSSARGRRADRPRRSRAAQRRRAGALRARRRRGRRRHAQTPPPSSGRRRPTPCRREGLGPTPAPSSAADRRPAARSGRRGRRAARARCRRTRSGGTRRAPRPGCPRAVACRPPRHLF